MKASELIKILEQALEKHGDLPVVVDTGIEPTEESIVLEHDGKFFVKAEATN